MCSGVKFSFQNELTSEGLLLFCLLMRKKEPTGNLMQLKVQNFQMIHFLFEMKIKRETKEKEKQEIKLGLDGKRTFSRNRKKE